jgi:hypothetical protein
VSSPTPHRFDDPIWPIRDVLGWILDRDPLKFGRLFTDEDTKSALVGTIRRPRTERDRQVLTTVLHALQCGELVTYNEADAVSRDFWTDKTPGYIQDSTRFLLRREDVLALWPDPRTQILRAPAPIRPRREGVAAPVINSMPSESREPNWQKWKAVPEVKLYEAVALSFNIDPQKLRRNPHTWMGGSRFREGRDFDDRLFIVERNLQSFKPTGSVAALIEGGEVFISLQTFGAWAVSMHWSLPNELVELATGTCGEFAPSINETVFARDMKRAELQSTGPSAQRRSGRKKGSGSIDDTERLQLMMRFLATEQARSVHDAACKVADSTAGSSQSRAAEITRIRTKFAKAHGTEPPTGKTWADVEAQLKDN